MAQDDSRWQDLMKMQETANSATNAASDQPSGQFNADDIEFEAFMFDPGTGPLPTLGGLNTDPSLGVATAVNPLAANLAAHTGGTGPLGLGGQAAPAAPATPAPEQPAPGAPSFDLTGQDAPLPPFLAGAEPQAQQQAEAEQPYWPTQQDEQPGSRIPAPRGTGPLGTQHSGSNLAARLSQLQGQQPTEGGSGAAQPRGTGPLGMRRGTGPLGGVPSAGTGPLGAGAAASTARTQKGGPSAPAEHTAPQPAPVGPINPAYFKTPTGPLGQRMRTGSLNPANLRPEPGESQATASAPAGATFGDLGTYTEQTQNDPTTWNDSTLSSVDDFSQVLLALYGLPANLPPVVAEAPAGMPTMSAGTAVQERAETDAAPEWAGLPFENAYSASTGPSLAEPATLGAEEAPVPGWGDMTGAPPENSYTATHSEVAAPGYDGPQLDYVVPLEEAEEQGRAAETGAAGGNAGDALEFDSFMFDSGHPSQILDSSMVETRETTPQAYGMDAVLQPQDEFDMEPLQFGAAPDATEVGAAPSEAAQYAEYPQPAEAAQDAAPEVDMQSAQEDADRGPLPFWLQDTSDLEVVARQGYVDMGLATTAEADTADATAGDTAGETPAMRATEPTAPPEPAQFEQQAVAEAPAEVAGETSGETAGETAEPGLAAPAQLEPAAEELDVAPFDMDALTAPAEAEAPEEAAALDLAPTLQADTYVEPEQALDAQAEPEVAVAAARDEESPGEFNYDDLPPIEPFDFTSLNVAPEEDDYGFNADELLGVMPSNRDPYRATADLDVLADIFEGNPVAAPEDLNTAYTPAASLDTAQTPQSAQRTPTSPALSQLTSPIASYLEPEAEEGEGEETATQSQLQAQLRAQMDAQAQAAAHPEPQPQAEPAGPAEPSEPAAPQPVRRETGRLGGGWTSAVTTTLGMGGIDGEIDAAGTEARETGMLVEPATAEPLVPQPSAPEPVVAEPALSVPDPAADPDFDIEPFDYSQLRLEEEQEIPTGMLDPRKARRPGTTGELIAPDLGGSLWTERPAPPAEEPEDDEESWRGTERDTSLFMSASTPTPGRGKATGWLVDDAATVEEPTGAFAAMPAAPELAPTPEPAPAPEQPAAEVQTGPATGTTGRGRKKAAADDSSAVKARVSWADATSPGLPTLPDDADLPSATTGPLTPPAQEVKDIEATVPRSRKQTQVLQPPAESALDTPDVDTLQVEPAPRRSRGKAAQAAPVETRAPEAAQEVEPVEEATPASGPTPAAATPIATPSVAPAPTPAPADLPEYTYQPMQGQEEAPQQVDMPKVGAGRSMYTSGPLPELAGFEELRQLVEQNPDDIGAHMALAAGYSQLGDLDTTLRVYRRVLRRRNIPAMFLSLIAEELNDYERELQGNAHFHQVRGDLYMKQGRHQEAIGEYNKIK